jgi:hypothetical protein
LAPIWETQRKLVSLKNVWKKSRKEGKKERMKERRKEGPAVF